MIDTLPEPPSIKTRLQCVLISVISRRVIAGMDGLDHLSKKREPMVWMQSCKRQQQQTKRQKAKAFNKWAGPRWLPLEAIQWAPKRAAQVAARGLPSLAAIDVSQIHNNIRQIEITKLLVPTPSSSIPYCHHHQQQQVELPF